MSKSTYSILFILAANYNANSEIKFQIQNFDSNKQTEINIIGQNQKIKCEKIKKKRVCLKHDFD